MLNFKHAMSSCSSYVVWFLAIGPAAGLVALFIMSLYRLLPRPITGTTVLTNGAANPYGPAKRKIRPGWTNHCVSLHAASAPTT